MIEVEIKGEGILLKTLEKGGTDSLTQIYNCNFDIRYATGLTCPVSSPEIHERLTGIGKYRNDILVGIFIPEQGIADNNILQFAGLISGSLLDNTLWIKLIAILPRFRRKGLGSKSVGIILKHCSTVYGTLDVFLSVIRENESGLRFWEKQGFMERDSIKKELFEGEKCCDVVIMHKSLNP